MNKILISIDRFPPDFTGAGLRALRLAERLNKNQNMSFKILCKGKSNINDKVRNIEVKRMKLIKETGIFFPFFFAQVFLMINLYFIKNRKKIELIHFFSFSWMNRVIMLANILFYKKKTVLEVTLAGSDDPKSLLSNGIRNKLLKYFTKYLLKRIDRIVVPSKQSVLSSLQLSIKKDKLWLRPHPVDKEIFGSVSFNKKESLRRKLKLPNKFIMLNIGMICPRKNQLFLVKCLEYMKRKDVALLLIGPESKENENYLDLLKKYIDEKNLNDQVVFLGTRKNVNDYMIASDLFVFASKSEGFPNVIAEAMVSGLPIVTLRLDSLNRFIDSNTGIVVSQAKKSEKLIKKQFVNAISRIYEHKIKYNSQEIRKIGLKLFSSEKIDKKYFDLYQNLLKENLNNGV